MRPVLFELKAPKGRVDDQAGLHHAEDADGDGDGDVDGDGDGDGDGEHSDREDRIAIRIDSKLKRCATPGLRAQKLRLVAGANGGAADVEVEVEDSSGPHTADGASKI